MKPSIACLGLVVGSPDCGAARAADAARGWLTTLDKTALLSEQVPLARSSPGQGVP